MNRRDRWTVAAVAAATAVGAGAAVALHGRRKAARSRAQNPAPASAGAPGAAQAPRRAPPRPQQNPSSEPGEGFEERWRRQRIDVLAICQNEPDVTSFHQALTCALNTAYPEAAPWTDPVVWTPWMRQAATLVGDELRIATAGAESAPRGWHVRAWLSGPDALADCGSAGRSNPALCAAQRLYPWADWAHPLPWQRELVMHLARMGVGG